MKTVKFTEFPELSKGEQKKIKLKWAFDIFQSHKEMGLRQPLDIEINEYYEKKISITLFHKPFPESIVTYAYEISRII